MDLFSEQDIKWNTLENIPLCGWGKISYSYTIPLQFQEGQQAKNDINLFRDIILLDSKDWI